MKLRNASITCLPASPHPSVDCAQRKVRGLVALVLMAALSMPSSLSAQVNPFALPDEIAEAEAFALGYQAYILGAVYPQADVDFCRHIHVVAISENLVEIFQWLKIGDLRSHRLSVPVFPPLGRQRIV